MGHSRPLPARALARTCPPAALRFRTTADLPDIDRIVGQERAVEAIDLAARIAGPGYNIFALGPPGIGKMAALRQSLEQQAAGMPVPDDWCYVHDFDDPQRPRALRLPAGMGVTLRDAMAQLCVELQGAIVAAFESEAYRERRSALESDAERARETVLHELEAAATAVGIAIVRTPIGLAVAPTRDGTVLEPDAFHALPDAEQARLRSAMEAIGARLEGVLHTLATAQRDLRRAIRALEGEVTRSAVRHLVDELRARFTGQAGVIAYLDAVEADVATRAPEILAVASAGEGGGQAAAAAAALAAANGGQVPDPFRRYRVNVLVDRNGGTSAPFVVADHPTVANLVGRVEHAAHLGTLVTDFTLIRPGALHRANGGYLVIAAEKLLTQPYAWESLKRALRTREVRVESVPQTLGLLTTVALEPAPIPLELKVALTGDRRLYYLLCAYDPEFLELFKVQADFEDEIPRTPETIAAYAGLMATLARRAGLRPLTAGAVARAIEHLSRLAADQAHLATQVGRLIDLLREADLVAAGTGRAHIDTPEIDAALAARRRRSGRIAEALQEQLALGVVRVETAGNVVGQVNALSVIALGDTAFGHPSRVTASVRMGRGEVVDIEREVELGGPLHSKGVLILSGFLGDRFGGPGRIGAPLALTASLVFEQSYGGVEGDSASLAELCALLSAIGGLPIRQDIALTGSVDQRGQVQAIGGVNEKIEGFFDACVARGLTGTQGVLIPAANVDHLMLDARVVAACRERRFRIRPVATVDEAMEILTGRSAGSRDADGLFPARSVNGHVENGLQALAQAARIQTAQTLIENAVIQ
ncbi:MAG: Lon protease family protein [Chloroflexota bacterium]